ncbi:MAG: 50S ribosomal protein L33 [candidate division WOR-3 bacterium]
MQTIVQLVCSECNRRNYTKERAKTKKDKLQLKKYCPRCRKHTLHKEK